MRSRSLLLVIACVLALAACSSGARSTDTDVSSSATSSSAPDRAPADSASGSGIVLPLRDDDPVETTVPATTEAQTVDSTVGRPSDPPSVEATTTTASTSESPTTLPLVTTITPPTTPVTAAPAVPANVVIDDRPPTTDLELDTAEEGVARNGDGNLVTLDQAGSLACAAAEGVLTALDEGTDPAPALGTLRSWSEQTIRDAVSDAVDAVPDAVTFADILPVLEACVTEGHEL